MNHIDSMTIEVEFDPQPPSGARDADLNINHTDPAKRNPYVVPLGAMVVPIELSSFTVE